MGGGVWGEMLPHIILRCVEKTKEGLGHTFVFATLSLTLLFTNLVIPLSWICHLSVVFMIQMMWQKVRMPTSLNEGRGNEACGWVVMW